MLIVANIQNDEEQEKNDVGPHYVTAPPHFGQSALQTAECISALVLIGIGGRSSTTQTRTTHARNFRMRSDWLRAAIHTIFLNLHSTTGLA